MMVSIPFKRESISKGDYSDWQISDFEFPFPSNGKAYPKTYEAGSNGGNPAQFPFPSNGKAYPKTIENEFPIPLDRFPFPSNGKAYPKLFLLGRKVLRMLRVSIPFKRESISKGYHRELHRGNGGRVSIPFKRESISKVSGNSGAT